MCLDGGKTRFTSLVGFMNNKKKRKKKIFHPKQLHHHRLPHDRWVLVEWTFTPPSPRFFSEITTTSREDRPVLFSLNYSPGNRNFLASSSFLSTTNGKRELKGWIELGPSFFHPLQDVSIRSYLRYKVRKATKEITRRVLSSPSIVISCHFYLSSRSNSKPRQSLAIACL